MKYNIMGKNIDVSKALKERVELKINKLDRFLPEDVEVTVMLSVEKLSNIIEVTIPLKKRLLRAEVSSNDMYAAIDDVADILEKQMVKYKSRIKGKARRDTSFKDEYNQLVFQDEPEEEALVDIQKSKRFALKPMDAEEAVMEMELLGHNFFVFRNGSTDEVNVVYKRKNGSYGLIEPEF